MIFEKGNYYHLYNRGCNKELLFRDESDFEKLIKIMKESKYQSYLEICAFSLMSNHYHFLVKQKTDNPVSKWIQYIFNAYSQYINHKYKRTGTLFEGRVKSKIIEKIEYMSNIVHYIHNNPKTDLSKKYCSISYLEDKDFISRDFYLLFFNDIQNYRISFETYCSNNQEEEIVFWFDEK